MAIDSAPEFDADAIESAILDAISTKYMCTRGRCKRMSRVMMKMSTDGLNPMMWKISVPVQNTPNSPEDSETSLFGTLLSICATLSHGSEEV